jgi:uncharacterized protein YihD (DUF1040 family)
MKDAKRIKKLLGLIEDIWTANPELRLTQLIGNCFDSGDNYYVEDDRLEESLRREYVR